MEDAFIGLIKLFPYGFAPKGWLLCNGATLQINQYATLYSLIGTFYGGHGYTDFMLPNLTDAEPANNTAYYICTVGLYPQRS